MHTNHREVEKIPTGLRREIAGMIEDSVLQMREHEERSSTRVDPITRWHVETHRARHPDGLDFAMPTDNTIRKSYFLDEWRE